MTNIITVEEFQNYKHISKKVDVDRIEQCISLAQQIDLRDYLGDFYFDVVANKDGATYIDLMKGSSFTIDSESYIHVGIKELLAELSYARYIYTSNVNDTPFGLVSKNSNDSTPLDRNMIKDLAKQSQIDADSKFSLINKYLEENASVFTRYCKGDNPNISTHSQRFDII